MNMTGFISVLFNLIFPSTLRFIGLYNNYVSRMRPRKLSFRRRSTTTFYPVFLETQRSVSVPAAENSLLAESSAGRILSHTTSAPSFQIKQLWRRLPRSAPWWQRSESYPTSRRGLLQGPRPWSRLQTTVLSLLTHDLICIAMISILNHLYFYLFFNFIYGFILGIAKY